jgi:hypothetical protein
MLTHQCRIDLSLQEVRELITQSDWDKLWQADQLRREHESRHVFIDWKESSISFPPTYKYCIGNRNYSDEVSTFTLRLAFVDCFPETQGSILV